MSQIATKRSSGNVTVTENMIIVDTGATYGTGPGTNVRRFTNLVYSAGTAISYVDDVGDGTTFTANEDGYYAFSYNDYGAADEKFGVTLNSSGLGTALFALPSAEIMTYSIAGANNSIPGHCSATVWMNAGDVLRCQSDSASLTGNDSRTRFQIVKIV